MFQIERIVAREILDSRGNPTVEADVYLAEDIIGRASVPSGASTGSHEALELRDGETRYLGKGVKKAIENINAKILPALQSQSFRNQVELDNKLIDLDGTENKSQLGANAILAVSMAFAKACSKQLNIPLYQHLNHHQSMSLPVPMMNILNGGAHADNNVDIQEFMVLPVGASSFSEALQFGVEIFHALKAELASKGLSTAVGDEGGFAPSLPNNKAAIELILKAVAQTGLVAGKEIFLGLDVASSEFYQQGYYHLKSENKHFDRESFVHYLVSLAQDYPIISIEDGVSENDWQGWQLLTEQLGEKIQLVGDDLFVTNAKILKEGIERKVANAILIKLNQIGTVSETLAAMQLATKAAYQSVVSHRSGETEDTFIADLSVATGCGQIKTGSLCRTDRVAKYNQLLRIEEMSGLAYAGKTSFEKFLY